MENKTACDLYTFGRTTKILPRIRSSFPRCKNLAVRVVLDKSPVKDSEVAGFIDELKKIPCLHFKAIPAEEVPDVNEPPETLPAVTDKD